MYNAKDVDGICCRVEYEHFNQPDGFCAWAKRKESGDDGVQLWLHESRLTQLLDMCDEVDKKFEMLNGGTLTAEQVRECVHHVYFEGYNDGSERRGVHTEETNWQAIADELIKVLCGGKCELAYGENDEGVDGWYTQCDGWFAATFKNGRMVHPRFCQLCGRKAVK